MSEEKDQVVDLKDQIFSKKEELTEAKSALRKFKKAHGIRTAEKISEEKVKAEFLELQAVTETLQKELDELNAQKPKKGSGVGQGLYNYGQVIDPVTKELRDTDKNEQKRWRAKARKLAPKLECAAKDVPWDENFLLKKEKEEKPKKEKVEKAPAEGAEEVATATPKKKKKSPEKDLD